MAAYTAMNSSNILGEVLKFATTSIPDSCEMCNRLYGNVSSPPLLLKTIRGNGLVKNTYLCNNCWCSCFTSGLNISEEIKASIRTLTDPEWDEKKKKAFVSKEWLSIKRGEILFQKHRVKKTQAKADFYEKEIYKSLRAEIKNKQEEIRKRNLSLIQVKNKMLCYVNSSKWVKEIQTQRIVKWYTEKKIKYETLQRILPLLHTSVEWKDVLFFYNSNRRIDPTIPPLPSWFEDM